jgi:hypothetical protein
MAKVNGMLESLGLLSEQVMVLHFEPTLPNKNAEMIAV